MVADMQIPIALGVNDKVVDTLDELIEDLTLASFSMAPNQAVSLTSTYSFRGNGIISQLYSLVNAKAGTYTGSNLIQTSDASRKYLKLATGTVGDAIKVFKNINDIDDYARISIGTAIGFKEYTIPNTSNKIFVFDPTYGQTIMYLCRGARTAANPADDEVYLLAQNLYCAVTDTSVTFADNRYYFGIPFILSVNQEHLPEEI